MRLYDTKVVVGKMAGDTNSFIVQDIDNQRQYTLDRTAARYYESIREGQILKVFVGGADVLAVDYSEHEQLFRKLSGK